MESEYCSRSARKEKGERGRRQGGWTEVRGVLSFPHPHSASPRRPLRTSFLSLSSHTQASESPPVYVRLVPFHFHSLPLLLPLTRAYPSLLRSVKIHASAYPYAVGTVYTNRCSGPSYWARREHAQATSASRQDTGSSPHRLAFFLVADGSVLVPGFQRQLCFTSLNLRSRPSKPPRRGAHPCTVQVESPRWVPRSARGGGVGLYLCTLFCSSQCLWCWATRRSFLARC
ncbi:hypothetical protein DFH06DRAFT_243440 [Mycena polygramma]|nr:hypothetical protein DFH06DRAFT_243440 [Mycena polygramma]